MSRFDEVLVVTFMTSLAGLRSHIFHLFFSVTLSEEEKGKNNKNRD